MVLMRHGPAVDREARGGVADPDRPLTDEGRSRTRAAARGLGALGVRPAAVLTSPYVRAVQTAALVCDALGLPSAEVRDELLPAADPAALVRHLAARSEACILCTGHEPHLGAVMTYLVRGRDEPEPFAGLKKAGCACVDTELPGRTGGDLVWLLPPRVLRRLAELP